MLDRFPQRDLGLWVFMCPTNNTLILSLFCVSLSGYHAEGYHVSSLPPRAITPVHTSRLPHQSYHAPPIHVHRVITPAISNSYFVVLSFAGFYATCTSPTPPPGATRYNLLHTRDSACALSAWLFLFRFYLYFFFPLLFLPFYPSPVFFSGVRTYNGYIPGIDSLHVIRFFLPLLASAVSLRTGTAAVHVLPGILFSSMETLFVACFVTTG